MIGAATREFLVGEKLCPELTPFGLGATGVSDCATPYGMTRVECPWVHVLVCLGGAGRVWVRGRWERCGEGDAYISPAGVSHAFEPLPGRRWRIAWGIYMSLRAWHGRLPRACVRTTGNGQTVSAAIEGLYREANAARSGDACRRWSGLVDFYWRQIAEQSAGAGALAPLWARVDQNLRKPWSVELLGREAGLGREQLRRTCRAETGRSPMAQVGWLRMNRAMTLLQTAALSVAAVAEAVGYENAFAFSTAFKRWAGRPPKGFLAR